MNEIESLIPQIWQGCDELTAAFSFKNQHLNTEADVPGLNLGMTHTEHKDLVTHNRHLWLQSLGGSIERLAIARQVHKTGVAYVHQPGIFEETDAMVTDQTEIWLAIQVADCAPVLLADRVNGVVGAAHAGWRGAVSGIVPKTIQKMKALGAKPGSMEAFVGPCLSFKNFEVGPEVAENFPDDLVDFESYYKPHADLKSLINRQLTDSGFKEDHIEISEMCTMDNDDQLYSHRKQNGKTGRMMAVIALR